MKGLFSVLLLLMLFMPAARGDAASEAEPESRAAVQEQEAGNTGDLIPEEVRIFKSESGAAYKGMPKEELPVIGFTKETMLDYYTYDNLEFMVFSDPTTVSFEDIVTFVIEDGKVIDWFKGYKEDVLPARM